MPTRKKRQLIKFDQTNIDVCVNSKKRGIYGLISGKNWIYIGRGVIKDRLLDHLNGDNDCITKAKPTAFFFKYIKDKKQEIEQEKDFIEEIEPSCNKKVG